MTYIPRKMKRLALLLILFVAVTGCDFLKALNDEIHTFVIPLHDYPEIIDAPPEGCSVNLCFRTNARDLDMYPLHDSTLAEYCTMAKEVNGNVYSFTFSLDENETEEERMQCLVVCYTKFSGFFWDKRYTIRQLGRGLSSRRD